MVATAGGWLVDCQSARSWQRHSFQKDPGSGTLAYCWHNHRCANVICDLALARAIRRAAHCRDFHGLAGRPVYYGGLIGATLAGILYARLKRLPLWRLADDVAPSIALGCVFGAWLLDEWLLLWPGMQPAMGYSLPGRPPHLSTWRSSNPGL